MSNHTLSEKDKSLLFWASFIALFAAGIGFGIRVLNIGTWSVEFNIDGNAAGGIFGASLWPIAVGMILFSLVVDKIGYKTSMLLASALLVIGSLWTVISTTQSQLVYSFLMAGFAHGIIEACINPLCATMYKQDKSKMLNILHASWPAGIVIGAAVCLLFGGEGGMTYRQAFILPAIAAAIFGIGIISGLFLKSAGRPLFFILCLIMIPLATAEIATDGWIKKLMEPVLAADYNIDSGWAIVLSSFIMMVLRFFAGVPLKLMNPPTLLLVSSLFSIAGLFLLSGASGILIFFAFVLYGIGQTFYWPTVLGFTSEQFPKGGAMTLNTVSAMGLLTVGIFGVPFLGAVADKFNADVVKKQAPELYEKKALNETSQEEEFIYAKPDSNFFGVKYDSVKADALMVDNSLLTEKGKAILARTTLPKNPTTADREAAAAALGEFNSAKPSEVKTQQGIDLAKNIQNNGRKTLKVAAVLPGIMAISFLLIMLWYKSSVSIRGLKIDPPKKLK